MADRWTDDRDEREWRDHQRRAGRYGRDDDYGGGDYSQRDYALGDYDTGYRSFQPRDRDRDRGRGPVFGERETGADYEGRYGGGYRGYSSGQAYGGSTFAGRSGYGRNQDAAGRYYGDDGRSTLYRGEFTTASPSDRSYSDYRTQRPIGRPTFGPEPTYRSYSEGRDRDLDREERGRDGRSFWDRASQRVASWFGEYDDDDDRRERDRGRETRQFGHRGRGPQGYKRADERISDEAHERLTDDPWIDATNIVVTVAAGEVTLAGTVDEREAKHRAERIVEDISGVNHVQNNIRVDRGNFLTNPGRGFGDSASEAQMRDRGVPGANASAGDGDLTLNPSAKGSSRTQ